MEKEKEPIPKKEIEICSGCGFPIDEKKNEVIYAVGKKKYHEDCFPPCPNGRCP